MTLGDGNMLPGFEEALRSFKLKQRETVNVSAEQAFGQYLEDNLQSFKRSEFADDMELQEGLVISFADAAGGELPGVIKTITEQTVMIDFNHPLAGRDILFTAEIHSVDAASSED